MKIFIYLTITVCLFMLVIGSTERDKTCDENPDYMYWPMSMDSTQVYLQNVKDYHKKVDEIERDIVVARTAALQFDDILVEIETVKRKDCLTAGLHRRGINRPACQTGHPGCSTNAREGSIDPAVEQRFL